MECPKCGYDREPEDTHCSLCGANFLIIDEQMAAQEALKQREAAQTESTNEAAPHSTVEPQVAAAPPSDKSRKQCPKCGADAPLDAEECLRCGIIFKRYEAIIAPKETEEKPPQEETGQQTEESESPPAEDDQSDQNPPLTEEEFQESTIPPQSKVAPPAPSSKTKRNIVIAVGALVIIGLIALLAVNLIENRLREAEKQALIQKKQEAERKLAERYHRITIDFADHQDEIINRLRTYVDNREFELFKRNLKAYDIPPLAPDLVTIKNYFKEIELVETLKKIPATNYQKNYEAYLTITQLAPENKRYQQKADYYRKKYADQKYRQAKKYFNTKSPTRTNLTNALESIKGAIELVGEKNKYRKLQAKLKGEELLYLEGNDQVRMAVRDDGLKRGLRLIHIWIKNVGAQAFYINLDFFALICKDGHNYSYNDFSRQLITKLESGEQVEGFLNFNTQCNPQKLVFAHSTAGTIFREFP